jgi:hypothetical protein
MKIWVLSAMICEPELVRDMDMADFRDVMTPYGAYASPDLAVAALVREMNFIREDFRNEDDPAGLEDVTAYDLRWDDSPLKERVRWSLLDEVDSTLYVLTETEVEGL